MKSEKECVKIWVDDVRPKPEDYDIALNSVNDVIAYLKWIRGNAVSVLLDLDHDAGDFISDGGDYIRILDWIEETGFISANPDIHLMFRIYSANPVGRENMRCIIEKNGWPLLP